RGRRGPRFTPGLMVQGWGADQGLGSRRPDGPTSRSGSPAWPPDFSGTGLRPMTSLMRSLASVLLALRLGLGSGPTSTTTPTRGVALILPLGWLASAVRTLFRAPQPLPNSVALARERGWSEVTLDVDDHGTALFLELSGRLLFTRAVIEYRDGEY